MVDWEAAQYEARLPVGWSYGRLLAAIEDRHPKLKGLFGRGAGDRLMHRESKILVGALLDLIGKRVASLPLHDGLMIAQSDKVAGIEAMRRSARAVTGMDFPVEEKN